MSTRLSCSRDLVQSHNARRHGLGAHVRGESAGEVALPDDLGDRIGLGNEVGENHSSYREADYATVSSFASGATKNCCLCGSGQGLSGEHKIKASALRAEFGRTRLVISRHDGNFKLAQSAGSKAFHFSARVCSECNNARTQPADLAFDCLHACVNGLISSDQDPMGALQDSRFAPGGAHHLGVFRYFAKLLCCHLAELGAPFQSEIARFAIGLKDHNCILLGIDLDQVYIRVRDERSDLPYAAHGGLIVLGDRETLAPTSFYSTLTIGRVRYKYQARLTEVGQVQLEEEAPEFVDWCRQRIRAAKSDPMTDETKIDLGLTER